VARTAVGIRNHFFEEPSALTTYLVFPNLALLVAMPPLHASR
jgi:hypothetical protein